jgi:hypothetical protein
MNTLRKCNGVFMDGIFIYRLNIECSTKILDFIDGIYIFCYTV